MALPHLQRPHTRNALDDTVDAIGAFLAALPTDTRALVLDGEGPHFCAGLDLSSLEDLDATAGIAHSQPWHRAFAAIGNGRVPVVAALHGAVIGGRLELAMACHIRVADATAFHALPEDQRSIFMGGSAAVHLLPTPWNSRPTPLATFAVLHALPCIAEADLRVGGLMKTLMAAINSGDKDTKASLRVLLDGRELKVTHV